MERVNCACGCGEKLDKYDNRGRERRFIFTHNTRGKNHPQWKGGRVSHTDGYIYLKKPNHPNSGKNGYVFEHRFIMSEHLGRPLSDKEVVHHINERKGDNRIENLKVLKNGAHTSYHNNKRQTDNSLTKNCQRCNEKYSTYNEKSKWCSYQCKNLGERNRINKTCRVCNDSFEVIKSRENKAKYCSRVCYLKSR